MIIKVYLIQIYCQKNILSMLKALGAL